MAFPTTASDRPQPLIGELPYWLLCDWFIHISDLTAFYFPYKVATIYGETKIMRQISDLARNALSDRDTYGIAQRDFTAYMMQVRAAKQRGIEFRFTLLGWRLWWRLSLATVPGGVRGCQRGNYVMARYGDAGAYDIDNVYLSTVEANSAAAHRDKPERPGSMTGQHLRVRGAGHPRSKAVLTPRGRFGSAALAAEAFGITRQCAAMRARSRQKGWSLA